MYAALLVVVCVVCCSSRVVSAFQVLSPSSLSTIYDTPSCWFNKIKLNNSTTKTLTYIDFDFCSDYNSNNYNNNNLLNYNDTVVMINYYNCRPSEKAYYAKRAGIMYMIIQSIIQPPGLYNTIQPQPQPKQYKT